MANVAVSSPLAINQTARTFGADTSDSLSSGNADSLAESLRPVGCCLPDVAFMQYFHHRQTYANSWTENRAYGRRNYSVWVYMAAAFAAAEPTSPASHRYGQQPRA